MATVTCFAAMTTQWRQAQDGRLIGMRYEALAAVMDMLGVAAGRRPGTFAGVVLMEAEVISASGAEA